MKILITSGGTKIPIDTVRDITNMSTGTFGTRIAEAFLRHGHQVHFIRAKESKSPMRRVIDCVHDASMKVEDLASWYAERTKWMPKYSESEYKTFEQYERCLRLGMGTHKPDVVVLAAAVSDYYVPNPMQGKLRSNDMLTIKLEALPKIINKVKGWAADYKPDMKLVGFKLLVGSTRSELILASKKSCEENGCDMVVANDLEDIKFNKHKILLVFPQAPYIEYHTDPNDPDFLAKKVVEHIEAL